MADHIKHHYIPQCYLKYFGHLKDTSSERHPEHFLHVFNKESQSSYTTSVENVCQIKHFYRLAEETISKDESLNVLSLEVEVLAQGIEAEYSSLLRLLYTKKENVLSQNKNIYPISCSEKKTIAEFIAIQHLRMPLYREQIMQITRDGYPKAMEIFKHLVAKVEHNPQISKLKLSYKYDEAMLHANMGFLNPMFVEPILTKLLNSKWLFAYSPSKDISTSNNPIVSFSIKDGMPSPIFWNSSVIYFPLFPDVLLILMPNNNECDIPDCTFAEIQDFAFKSYHNYLALQSTEVYNYNNNFDKIKEYING